MTLYFVTVRDADGWAVFGDHYEAPTPGEATRQAWAEFMTPFPAEDLDRMSPELRAIAIKLEAMSAEKRALPGLQIVVRKSRSKHERR